MTETNDFTPQPAPRQYPLLPHIKKVTIDGLPRFATFTQNPPSADGHITGAIHIVGTAAYPRPPNSMSSPSWSRNSMATAPRRMRRCRVRP